jgi:Zn-dependent metalloprotease
MTCCQFVPPFLLEKLASSHPDGAIVDVTRRTLAIDSQVRSRRMAIAAPRPVAEDDASFPVYTADNGSDLPGTVVRKEGAPATGDPAEDEAYDGVQASLAMYAEVYGRSSFDGAGAPVLATVHYEQGYDNAFWNGEQLVFGDGDGQIFGRFTRPVDVLGHELTHAVTQYTANLTYQGQSGALNESISDVFGSCLKQRLAGESAGDADWLIGEGIFEPSVQGKALRSMAEPGTAYDDPNLGKDPQVGSMDEYVDTSEDNGGVHTNSGIPNRAFYLAATGIGGNSWDGAGKIWYAALTSGLGPDTDFAGFADATIRAAAEVSSEAEQAVTKAWETVGVTVGTAVGSGAGTGSGSGAPAE